MADVQQVETTVAEDDGLTPRPALLENRNQVMGLPKIFSKLSIGFCCGRCLLIIQRSVAGIDCGIYTPALSTAK